MNMAACTTGTAVDDARGLCPSGWHVPTDGEFMTLEMELDERSSKYRLAGTDQAPDEDHLGMEPVAWNGTNSSGFSGLPGGYRYTMGTSAARDTDGGGVLGDASATAELGPVLRLCND